MGFYESANSPLIQGKSSCNTESSGDIVRTRKVEEVGRSFINPQTTSYPSGVLRCDYVVHDGTHFVLFPSPGGGVYDVANSSDGVTFNNAGDIPGNLLSELSVDSDGMGKIVINCASAVGQGKSHYSTNHGVTWNLGGYISDGDTSREYNIVYSKFWNKWFAFDRNVNMTGFKMSDDGITWTTSNTIGTSLWKYCATNPNNGVMVIVSSNGNNLVSYDGGATFVTGNSGNLSKVYWADGMFWGMMNTPEIKVSADGLSWTNISTSLPRNDLGVSDQFPILATIAVAPNGMWSPEVFGKYSGVFPKMFYLGGSTIRYIKEYNNKIVGGNYNTNNIFTADGILRQYLTKTE